MLLGYVSEKYVTHVFSHPSQACCYHLSKQLNCFRGICDGLVIWQPRFTADTLSRTRHIISIPTLSPTSTVVTPNGGANPMMHVSSITPVSVPVPVPFPQLS